MSIVYCSVDSCDSKRGSGLSFFRCPKDEARCQLWKKQLGFTGSHKYACITSNKCYDIIRVCSLHFTDYSFMTPLKKGLKYNAVPTLFLSRATASTGNDSVKIASTQTDVCSHADECIHQTSGFITQGVELRKKWKNIRDCYKKYLRSVHPTCTSPAIMRSYKNWQWADSMEFCKPHIFNDAELLNFEGTDEIDDQFFENPTVSTTTANNSLNSAAVFEENKKLESINGIPNYQQPSLNNLDATDLIFLGYSKIIKSFSLTKQAIIKMKIAQTIMEEELQNAEILESNSSSKEVPSTSLTKDTPVKAGNKSPKPKRGRKRKLKRSGEEEHSIGVLSEDKNIYVSEDIFNIKVEIDESSTSHLGLNTEYNDEAFESDA